TPAASVGGPRRYGVFRNMLVHVRKNFLYPSPKDNGVKSGNRLKPLAAIKYLRAFNRRVMKGMNQGTVVTSTGESLIDQGNAGIQALLQFYENAPKPQ